jgi:kinetochore protein Fta7
MLTWPKRILENQLTPAMHSVDLLNAEIEKEEMQLERDQEVLAKLEGNAKAEKTRQREQVTKVIFIILSATNTSNAAPDPSSLTASEEF